ncbi:MAG: elongation factor G [Paracoccaceae bacterium]
MRCFTVLGPSQSGKSTLVKALSQLESRTEPMAFGDGLALTAFDYLDEAWCALDVAGDTDHLGTAGSALAASDAAVLCVDPSPDSAPLVAPWLRLVESSGVPCFLFINRMDAHEGRIRDAVAALQGYAGHSIVLRQVPFRKDGHVVGAVDLISERAWAYRDGEPSDLVEIPADIRAREEEARGELLEHLADFNDALLEQLIEDQKPATDDVFHLIADLHRHNDIIAAYLGSALHRNGVNRLMKSLRHEAASLAETRERLGGALAVAPAAEFRKHVGKSVLLRALGDGVAQGSGLGGDSLGNLTGLDGKPVTGALAPGALAVAAKSDHLDPGRSFDAAGSAPLPGWSHPRTPQLRRILTPTHEKDDARLSAALARVAAVDNNLALATDPETGHTAAFLQGPMHLRRLIDRLAEDFTVEAEAHPVSGSYRETITAPVTHQYRHRKQSGGAGQFADVHLTVRPTGRGEGFAFDEVVKGGAVPRNYIPSVASGAEDALAQGPLGCKVIDVAVTLTDGKHHSVDSSDHAFRTAAQACVREALREAKPVLLQPIDKVTIHVPSVYTGSLVALLSSLKGQVLGFEAHETAKGWDVFRALLPVPAHDELGQSLSGLTHGTAWYESDFDHYEELHGKEAEKARKDMAAAAS